LKQCINTNLVLNYEKCHFRVQQGIVFGRVVSTRGIEVDKAKVDLITILLYPTNVKDIRSFLGHANFYRRLVHQRFLKNYTTIVEVIAKGCTI